MRPRSRGAGARGHDSDGSAGAECRPVGRTGGSDPVSQNGGSDPWARSCGSDPVDGLSAPARGDLCPRGPLFDGPRRRLERLAAFHRPQSPASGDYPPAMDRRAPPYASISGSPACRVAGRADLPEPPAALPLPSVLRSWPFPALTRAPKRSPAGAASTPVPDGRHAPSWGGVRSGYARGSERG
jgi:hypothetical protein